jgi:hypothetical protein
MDECYHPSFLPFRCFLDHHIRHALLEVNDHIQHLAHSHLHIETWKSGRWGVLRRWMFTHLYAGRLFANEACDMVERGGHNRGVHGSIQYCASGAGWSNGHP